MSSILEIQYQINHCVGQLAVLDLALSSDRISDALNEDEVDGLSGLVNEIYGTLSEVVVSLDEYKPTASPEEQKTFRKLVGLVSQAHASMNTQVAVN